jgi:hypothetical protein
LRGRVVALSLICFVLLWGIVFAQMATGNDPVLSGKGKTVAARSTASPRKEIETTDPRELNPELEAEASEAEPEVEFEAEPLVTSQS